MAKTVFQIEQGRVAFALVDTSAVGYTDSWQAPNGADVTTVTMADYEASAANWSCQVTSGQLSAEPNENDVDVPATFCEPASTIPQPGQTGFQLDAEFLQDPNVVDGLSRFLFEHDTEQAYFLLGLDGDNPPRAIGRVRLLAGAFGGTARETLTADVSLPLARKPQILFGTAAASEAVPPTDPGGEGEPMMATAGTTKATKTTSK